MKRLFGGRRGLRLAALAFLLAGLGLLLPLWSLAHAQEGAGSSAPPASGDGAAQALDTAALVPAARWELDPAAPRVGDPITLSLQVEHSAGLRLVAPRLPAAWGPLELLEQGAPQTLPAEGPSGSRLTLRARAFVTGSLATPPLTLRLVDDQGASQTLEAPPAIIQVQATLRSAAELPKDLRPQAALPPRHPWTRGLALLAAAGGLLLAFSGARGLRPLPPPVPEAPAPAPDPQAPWRRALADLEQLDGMGLLAQGRSQAHYSLAVDILRRYLEERWGLPALEQTSAELLAQLSAQGRPAAAAAYLGPLLREADLVKFARLEPDPGRAGGLTARLRDLLGFWEGQA